MPERPHHRDPLQRDAQHAHRRCTGRCCPPPLPANARARVRDDGAARRDRRLHDLSRPADRARPRLSPHAVALLNALAIGILLYLVVEIAQNAIAPISQGARRLASRRGCDFRSRLIVVFIAGLLIGLVGLGSAATHATRRRRCTPRTLSCSRRSSRSASARTTSARAWRSARRPHRARRRSRSALIVGFGLHNATEGFGVAAPLVGRVVPSWAQIGLAGLVAGGPTFVGTIIGYTFYSPTLSVLFLAIAIGALVFVIGELWSVLAAHGPHGIGHRNDVCRFLDRARNRAVSRHQRGLTQRRALARVRC